MTNDPNENRGPEEQNDQTAPQQGDAPEQAEGQPPQQPAGEQTPPAGTTPETPPEQPAQSPEPQAGQPAGGEMGKKIEEMANMQIGGFSLCKIVALGGAALLFLSFFLPWWGISVEERKPGDDVSADARAAARQDRDAARLDAVSYMSPKQIAELSKDMAKDDKGSLSLYGWNLGGGIVTFIFSLLILGILVALMFVPALKPFAMFGLLLGCVCLPWWFSS